MLWTILLVVLILALLGGVPQVGFYQHNWASGGGLGLVLVVVLIVLLLRGGP